MKTKVLISVLALSTALQVFAAPGVIDLKQEGRGFLGITNSFTKTYDQNETLTYRFDRSQYVEQLMISAEGAQRAYSFAKVYADGDEVATLGVPGRDPDYPVIIRGNVSEIVVKIQPNSRVKILDFKIYTEQKMYSSYVSMNAQARRGQNIENWGTNILDLVHEFNCLSRGGQFGAETFTTYLKPLKVAAIKVQASDNAHDARSLSTKEKANLLLDAIDAAAPLFESDYMLVERKYDRLGVDLLTIKEDIIEKYDLNRR
jgi:hypothetical protein